MSTIRALATLTLAAALTLLPGAPLPGPAGPAGAQAQTVSVAAREGRRNLAFNLNGVTDWSAQQPFIDVMRTARPWEGHLRGQWGGIPEAELIAGGYLDSDGWVLSVPPRAVKMVTLVLVDLPEDMNSVAGRYHVQWEGSAYLGFSGRARNVRYTGRNSASFDFTPGPGQVIIEFNRGDLRNLSVVHERHLDRFAAGEVFNPDWLALIGDAENLRFMDWMDTNDSTLSTWADRPRVEDYSWARRGVPLEVMLDLANQTGIEPWFTLPHLADDDHIRRFGQMVQDRLRPDLRAWVELSNEVWNWQFTQAQWAEEQARERWGQDSAWVQFYALRAAQMVQILDDVFGDEPERLVRVLATHTGWLGLETDILDPPLIRGERLPAPYTLFDAYAVTGYFSGPLHSEENAPLVQDWLVESLARAEDEADALGLTGEDRAAHVAAHRFDHAIAQAVPTLLTGAGLDTPTQSVMGHLDRVLTHHAAVAAAHDLALVMYEGGTHVLARPDQHDDEVLLEFLTALNYSDGMGTLYQALIDGWGALTDAPFNAFVDVAAPTRWGSWGHLRHLDDDNPRWQALMQATRP